MNKLIFLILIICLIPLVSSEDRIYKKSDCIDIVQSCSNCSFINISAVTYPNSSLVITNQTMIKISEGFYSYNFCFTNETGYYYVFGYKDENITNERFSYTFLITNNGKELPTDNVKVFFFIAFLLLVGLTCFLTIYTIGHFITLDFDVIDLSVDWGILFVVIGLLELESYYLGNQIIEEYFIWFISIGTITLGLIPALALVFSIIVGGLIKQKVEFKAPQKIRFRR